MKSEKEGCCPGAAKDRISGPVNAVKTDSAEIISVGTELLLGDIINTDAAYLARELAALGIPCYYQSVVGDNPARLRGLLETAKARSRWIFLTGGLGPTCDDLTKETAAEVMGKTLVLHEPSYARIREILLSRKLPETDNQKKQAMLPADAVVFQNDYGTAPGFAMEDGGTTMILMPGPPRELEPMFAERVRPYLAAYTAGGTIYSLNLGLFGIGEAAVEACLRERMENDSNPTVAPYCGEGEVRLRITARAENEEICRAMCSSLAAEIRETPCLDGTHTLSEFIYGVGVSALEEAAVSLLRENGLTVTAAESCTGGYVAKRLTDIPGASDVLKGSFVTYSEQTKREMVFVSAETLEKHSVYSFETAREMALGAKRVLGADIGIGVTGIAGPDGEEIVHDGIREKLPAGTVFLVCAYGKDDTVLEKRILLAPGNRNPIEGREFVRRRASSHALSMILAAAKALTEA